LHTDAATEIIELEIPSYLSSRRIAIKRLPSPASLESQLRDIVNPVFFRSAAGGSLPRQVTRSVVIEVSDAAPRYNASHLQGRAIALLEPEDGQAYLWNATTSLLEPKDVTVPEATATAVGTLQLTNDLGGTATEPIVRRVQELTWSAAQPLDGQQPVWNDSASLWQYETPETGTNIIRDVVTVTAVNLASGATADVNAQLGKSFALFRVETSAPAWVRIYSNAAYRSSDADRSSTQEAEDVPGVIAELVTTPESLIVDFSPVAVGAHFVTNPDGNIPLAVRNLGATVTNLVAQLTRINLEE